MHEKCATKGCNETHLSDAVGMEPAVVILHPVSAQVVAALREVGEDD